MLVPKKTNAKYPGLSKLGDIKIRHELYDQDYLHKLNDAEKAWLSNFNLEYISVDFNHTGERIHKEEMESRRIAYTGKIRHYDIGKKDAHDRNNARNRDAFSITKANFILEGEKAMGRGSSSFRTTRHDELEDVLIELIDLKLQQKSSL